MCVNLFCDDGEGAREEEIGKLNIITFLPPTLRPTQEKNHFDEIYAGVRLRQSSVCLDE